MDSTKKKHFDFLLAALAICCFITMDVYVISTKGRQEIVTAKNSIMISEGDRGGLREGFATYKDYIVTDNGKYLLPLSIYQYINVGSVITINRSEVTQALKSISYSVNGKVQTVNINGMDISGCMFFVFVTMAGILLTMIFYNRIVYLPGRGGLTGLFSVGAVVLLLVYIALNIFYIDL